MGCHTDRLTFPVHASCFTHYNVQGECFPRGGVMEMAKALIAGIERGGGRVLTKERKI